MDEDDLARRVALKLREGEGPTQLFDLALDAVGVGHASVSMTVTPAMLNGMGSCHGGVIFTLADTALAYACNSRNDANVAQNASISFLSPGLVGDRLTAEAREVAVHGRSGAYLVTVRAQDGRTVAAFNGLSRTLGRPITDLPFPSPGYRL